jgi:hypothetical protein
MMNWEERRRKRQWPVWDYFPAFARRYRGEPQEMSTQRAGLQAK